MNGGWQYFSNFRLKLCTRKPRECKFPMHFLDVKMRTRSSVEDDPHFLFVANIIGKVKISDGKTFSDLVSLLFKQPTKFQQIKMNDPYDADESDTETNLGKNKKITLHVQQNLNQESFGNESVNNYVFQNLSISAEKIKVLQH